jgi:dihydrofolate reductase
LTAATGDVGARASRREWIGLAVIAQPCLLYSMAVSRAMSFDSGSGLRANVGAEIMGRGKFGGGPGPWGDDPWPGGGLRSRPSTSRIRSHPPRARPLTLSDTTFTFVTDGIESALDQARKAAAGKDIVIGGAVDVINQYLAAGLVDELELHIVPLLLGGGGAALPRPRPRPRARAGSGDRSARSHSPQVSRVGS